MLVYQRVRRPSQALKKTGSSPSAQLRCITTLQPGAMAVLPDPAGPLGQNLGRSLASQSVQVGQLAQDTENDLPKKI